MPAVHRRARARLLAAAILVPALAALAVLGACGGAANRGGATPSGATPGNAATAGGAAAGPAEWIWTELPVEWVGPVAFWAVRDFELAGVPDQAELLALADEEYVLWLNGHRVGSNRYRAGAPLDVYRVAPLLVPGANRLAVELRSSRGAGGLLAALRLPETGATPVVTDSSWRILPRHHPGIVPAWQPVTGGEAALSWGRPPVGRWGMPGRGPVRPLAAQAGRPCDPLPATGRQGDPPGRVVFDFGREVTGYLALARDPAAAAGPTDAALLLTGDRPLAPLEHPREAVSVVTMPGQPVWTDVVPRRFRYATVTGLPGLVSAEVLPVAPEAFAQLPQPPPRDTAGPGAEAQPTGVLGLEPPVRTTPVEEAVRKRVLEHDERE